MTGSKHFIGDIEEQILAYWQNDNVFEKSVSAREGQEHYEFYDGPPFANGLPHVGHAASSIVKDAVPRYYTMKGYHVPRRFGWDCHGLPAEMKAENDLDLGSKAAIEEYGVEKFVDYCRTSVTEFTKEWEHYVSRLGRWVDFDDNYYTMDESYMESVMWAFKQLYEQGLVSEGFKVMPYCHVCETSLSHFETRQDDSYRDRTDPAVTIRFPLETGESLLAWTTTPWTLPANLAVAVNQDLTYAVMEGNGERIVIAEGAVERYEEELNDYKKVETKKGKDFLGKSYEPPFDYFVGHKNSHVVLHADFVTDEDGTGIAHEAPGFGEEDQVLCEANNIEVVVPVDKQGRYTKEVEAFENLQVFDANPKVIQALDEKGRLFKKEDYLHPYPHCWRTDNPLIYRAVSSWAVDVPKLKQKLLDANQEVNWIPENVKDGAFGKWLEGVRLWNVSRDRYWGAPIPVWKTDDGEVVVIGSMEELRERAVDPDSIKDLHKPFIDDIVVKTDSGKEAKRVSEVFDCWFESGSMPYAQHNYPFSGEDKLNHPADFIVEYIGQTRGWFYTLHVLSVALFDKPAFKNVISHGVINGTDGRKLSKKLQNYPDMQHIFDQYGADALRLYLLESPVIVGETIDVDEKAMQDVQRNVILRLLNSYQFFSTYTEVDNWKPPQKLEHPKTDSELDNWILARVEETLAEMTKQADEYNLPKAVRPLRDLIDDLSNWYIRRSRRRFWKSDDDGDKLSAYNTLWYSLVKICQIMAPWAPFISEHIYRKITVGCKEMPDSVHMTDWPQPEKYDRDVLEQMNELRQLISEGLSKRADAGIKVRQPLASATLTINSELSPEMLSMAQEELNVKQVTTEEGETLDVSLDTKITEELKLEGLMREIVRQTQNARKKAGLNVEDRIKLHLSSKDADVSESIKQHNETICTETLATEFSDDPSLSYSQTVKIASAELIISLEKV